MIQAHNERTGADFGMAVHSLLVRGGISPPLCQPLFLTNVGFGL